MMPAASRKTDIALGHACYPPSAALEGSDDVEINGLPALRQGDAVEPHGCSSCVTHDRMVSAGSPTVFVNGKPLARIGDAISCGGEMEGGSEDVYVDQG